MIPIAPPVLGGWGVGGIISRSALGIVYAVSLLVRGTNFRCV